MLERYYHDINGELAQFEKRKDGKRILEAHELFLGFMCFDTKQACVRYLERNGYQKYYMQNSDTLTFDPKEGEINE